MVWRGEGQPPPPPLLVKDFWKKGNCTFVIGILWVKKIGLTLYFLQFYISSLLGKIFCRRSRCRYRSRSSLKKDTRSRSFLFFSSLLYYCDLFVGSMPGGAFAQVSALLLPQRNTFLQRVRGKYISGLYKKNV